MIQDIKPQSLMRGVRLSLPGWLGWMSGWCSSGAEPAGGGKREKELARYRFGIDHKDRGYGVTEY